MRPPGWRSGLRQCIAVLAVPPETLSSSPGSVTAGRDREVHGAMHNWPSVVWVREGLAGRNILVSSRTSDSCGGPGAAHADQVARRFLRHIGAAGFCVKKQCGLVGLCFGGRKDTYDGCLSRARMRVVAMRQDSN
jgi:hypothetical protein